eukprot:TRINITY_DN3816_c0_g1_i12.p1 TRINITY_DN3816_c0_g1~~TRINITY_DN3816_c0_g1_i12.p1  ORF type:complete len:199 (+),score=20.00 TRINITY_DN3816_c0_g1_i12:154-750(+)
MCIRDSDDTSCITVNSHSPDYFRPYVFSDYGVDTQWCACNGSGLLVVQAMMVLSSQWLGYRQHRVPLHHAIGGRRSMCYPCTVALQCAQGGGVRRFGDGVKRAQDWAASLPKPLYLVFGILAYGVFVVDCQSIHAGAGACDDYYSNANVSCGSGQFIGLAAGELLITALVALLYKLPTSGNLLPLESFDSPSDPLTHK